MADESMVPQGLPYGERKRQVAMMRRAGVPLAPRRQAAGSGSGLPVPAAAAPRRAAAAPSPGLGLGFDPFTDLTPNEPWDFQPPQPNENLRRVAATTQNSFLRVAIDEMLRGRQ